MEIRKQRYEVVELFLSAGLPLLKVDTFRPFFAGLGVHLTHSSHLRHIVPQVLMAEKNLILEEVEKEYVSFTFDGTTRVGECINGILRFCTADFNLVQRLSLFVTLEKSTNGDELKTILARHLMADLSLDAAHVTAFIRDSCATNGKAMRGLTEFFPHSQ